VPTTEKTREDELGQSIIEGEMEIYTAKILRKF
jgi:hypothetical protein